MVHLNFFTHASHYVSGVGGWADVGVDPAVYARQLMNESEILEKTTRKASIHTKHGFGTNGYKVGIWNKSLVG